MPLTFRLKRSSTPGATPAAGALSAGELAVNTADGRAYIKKDDGSVVNLPVSSIAGQAITPSDIDLTTAGTAAAPALSFTGDPNTGIYNPSADTLSVATGGVQRLAVTSTGVLDLLSGQIKFPAAVSLSADANTLDDYEEGTWTPTFTAATTNPTVTYNTANTFGRYVKIGRTVVIQGRILLTATSGGSGALAISGLPFAASLLSSAYIGYRELFTGTIWPTHGYVLQAATSIQLATFANNANTFPTPANLTATTQIIFGAVYQTDA